MQSYMTSEYKNTTQ